MHKRQEFPVAPLGLGAWLWLVIPLLFALGAATVAMTMEQQRTSAPWMWLSVPLVALIGAGLGWAMRRRRILLDNRQLHVHATLYTKKLAVEAIDLDKARVVSLEEHTDLKPRLKTNGFGMPGLQAGHFRLRNLTRAFCLITDRTRVLALPLRDGGLVLVSPERPADLLARLRELATATPRR